MIVSSAIMASIAFIDSFILMAFMRVFLGFVSSAFNPLSFSILADYFPKEKRATVNSILQSGNYIGWGLSSISIIAISRYGWRATYGILGLLALLIGISALIVIREP